MAVIVLAGTIGAGKSSLTALIANRLGSEAFYESVDDNEVLPLFYAEPEKYAFLLQIYFLNKRFDSIKQALTHENNVLDRSIYDVPTKQRSKCTMTYYKICSKNCLMLRIKKDLIC